MIKYRFNIVLLINLFWIQIKQQINLFNLVITEVWLWKYHTANWFGIVYWLCMCNYNLYIECVNKNQVPFCQATIKCKLYSYVSSKITVLFVVVSYTTSDRERRSDSVLVLIFIIRILQSRTRRAARPETRKEYRFATQAQLISMSV